MYYSPLAIDSIKRHVETMNNVKERLYDLGWLVFVRIHEIYERTSIEVMDVHP